MSHEDTVKLLTLVKGNWYRQPTDDLTIGMWREILGEEIDARDAWEAVMDIVRAGAEEPPTPGMIHRSAMDLAKRREDQERRKRRSIEEPLPSDEERQRMKQRFRDIFDKLAHSVAARDVAVSDAPQVGATESAVTMQSSARAIDPETERAQKIILDRRRERKNSKGIERDDRDSVAEDYGNLSGPMNTATLTNGAIRDGGRPTTTR